MSSRPRMRAPTISLLPPTTTCTPGTRWSADAVVRRSEEHTSELQSLMRISYAVFCLKKKIHKPSRALDIQLFDNYQRSDQTARTTWTVKRRTTPVHDSITQRDGRTTDRKS